MATHDYIIANGTGAAVRADINLALQAIVSLNSSAAEPATMYAYQLWADTNTGLLKIRNGANSAWITLRQLDGDFSIVAAEDGLQATPSLTFTNDLNTGIFRPGNDSLAIVTGATRAITITSTQAVGIQTANPSTALHVAGNARVGADDVTDAHLQIGKGATGNRNSYIDIVGDTTYTDYGLRFIRNNTGANATSEIKHRGTGNLNFTTQEAGAIQFNTNNSPSVTITSGGLVGIGTSAPNKLLHIYSGASDSEIRLQSNSGTEQNAYITLRNSGGKLDVYSVNGDIALNPGNNVAATFKADGKVGIGTTSPGELLSLNNSSSNAAISIRTGGASFNSVVKFNADDINYAGIGLENTALVMRCSNSSTPTERARIDSSGRLLVGTSSGRGVGTSVQALTQIETTNYVAYSAVNNTNDTGGSALMFGKSRGTAVGSNTIVQNGDNLGDIYFAGANGTDLESIAARITCTVDGTPGANDMPGRLVFSTTADGASSTTERMRITNGGLIDIGGLYSVGANSIRFDVQGSNFSRNTTSSATQIAFVNPNGTVGTITTSGSATAYNTSSDYRLKENVSAVTNGITRLQQLKPSRFNFIAEPDKTVDGFIAHEVQAVVPEAITGEKDAVDAHGKPVYQGIDQSKLVPLLTAALQEAIGEIEKLKARVVALESKP